VCLANLKTLGAAALLYARDYEDKIPCWGIEFDEIGAEQGDPAADWLTKTTDSLSKAFEYGYIWEYVQIRSAFTCPSLTNKMNGKIRVGVIHSHYVWGWPDGQGTQNPPGPMWSYEVNGQPGRCMNDPQWRANPELVLPNPAGVMMLFEQDYRDYAAFDNSVTLCNPTYDTRTNAEDSLGRYHKVSGIGQLGVSTFNNRKGSGNIVFFDGHVDDMSIEEFIIKRSTAQGTIELCGGYEGFTWPGFE
jgi:prepilin-type processing-associated H-X9-DG protein